MPIPDAAWATEGVHILRDWPPCQTDNLNSHSDLDSPSDTQRWAKRQFCIAEYFCVWRKTYVDHDTMR